MRRSSVSLIMPVYNTDDSLLTKTIESIKSQTCDDWTLWIVDDGSCQRTAEFCDTFTVDPRIKVVHQSNGGVSRARNDGTCYANDPYVMYIDSDDVLTEYAIEDALRIADLTNADVVYGGTYKIRSQDEITRCADLRGANEQFRRCSADDLRKCFLGSKENGLKNIQGTGYIGRGPWAKLMKSDVAKATPFPIGFPIGEDMLWNLRVCQKAKNIVVADSIWYGYVEYGSSAISKYYGNREEIVSKWVTIMLEENMEFCDKNKEIVGYMLTAELYCIVQFDLLSAKCSLSMRDKNLYLKKIMKQYPWKLMKNKEYRKTLTRGQKLFLFISGHALGGSFVSGYIWLKSLLSAKNLSV